MLLDVCLGGVHCEGGEVCVFLGCVKEGPGKACMLLVYMYERKRYIMIFYHDISVMEPAGAH